MKYIVLVLVLLITFRSVAQAVPAIDAVASFASSENGGAAGTFTIAPPLSGSCTGLHTPFHQCSGLHTSATLPASLPDGECLAIFVEIADNQNSRFPTNTNGVEVPWSNNSVGFNGTEPIGLLVYHTTDTTYFWDFGHYPSNFYGGVIAMSGTACAEEKHDWNKQETYTQAWATQPLTTANADLILIPAGSYGTVKQDCTGTSNWPSLGAGFTTQFQDGNSGDSVSQQYAGAALYSFQQSSPGSTGTGTSFTMPCGMKGFTTTVAILPASVPTPTATPTPSCNTGVTTTDPTFTHGTAAVHTVSINFANSTSADVLDSLGHKIWNIVASAWGTSSTYGSCIYAAGDGCSITTYTPNSNVTIEQNFSTGSGATGTNTCLGYVGGYSFINLGLQSFPNGGGIANTTQPPTFPAELDTMCSLTYDAAYTWTGTRYLNLDELWDNWLMPTQSNPGGTPQALEVEIPAFIDFQTGAQIAQKYVGTLQIPVIANGVSTPTTWTAYIGAVTNQAGDIGFLPSTSVEKGEYQVDVMPFMRFAQTAYLANCGAGSITGGTCWNTLSGWTGNAWLAGTNFGTEWGQGGCIAINTTIDYTMSLSKYAITQTGYAAGTPGAIQRSTGMRNIW